MNTNSQYIQNIEIPTISTSNPQIIDQYDLQYMSLPVATLASTNNTIQNNDITIPNNQFKTVVVNPSTNNLPVVVYSNERYTSSSFVPSHTKQYNIYNDQNQIEPQNQTIPQNINIENININENNLSIKKFFHLCANHYNKFEIFVERAHTNQIEYEWNIYGIKKGQNQKERILRGREKPVPYQFSTILEFYSINKTLVLTSQKFMQLHSEDVFSKYHLEDHSIEGIIDRYIDCTKVSYECSTNTANNILEAQFDECKKNDLIIKSNISEREYILTYYPLPYRRKYRLHFMLTKVNTITETDFILSLCICHHYAKHILDGAM